MLLSKTRRRVLLACRKWEDQGGPTFWGLMGRQLVMHLAGAAGLILVCLIVRSPALLGVAVGFFIGCVYRDAVTIRRQLQSWWVLADVVDWQRVDRLLAQDREERGRRAEEHGIKRQE
jgi:hypothetical protein